MTQDDWQQRYGWLCRELRIAAQTGDRRGAERAQDELAALEDWRRKQRVGADHSNDRVNTDFLGWRHVDTD